MLARLALIGYALATALIFSTTVQAAPAGEPTSTTDLYTADLANTLTADFSSIDVDNAQRYASTEVDTEAALAPTSLPMTNEEMALAEVAAIVADLTTATAAEIKAKEQAIEFGEDGEFRGRAEEAKRQANEREIANEKDIVAATTFRASFADAFGTTSAAPKTTTESPAILNELVKAAAAANEILAAALNAATMSATNANNTTAVDVATTIIPEATTSTEATVDDDGLLAVIGSEKLPEAGVTWQPNDIQTTNIAATITSLLNSDTTDAGTTVIPTATSEIIQTETTPNANISNESKSDNFLVKPLERGELGVSVSNSQKASETGIEQTAISLTTTVRPTDNEVAESKQILTINEAAEATEATPASYANVVENEATTGTANVAEHFVNTKVIDEEAPQIPTKNKKEEAASSTSSGEQPPTENTIQVAGVEIAKVEEVKLKEFDQETNRERSATTTETEELSETTTEPLETLIAVESEARSPNQIEAFQAAPTPATTMPEGITTAELAAAQSPADAPTTTSSTALQVDETEVSVAKNELKITTTTEANEVKVESNGAGVDSGKEIGATQPTAISVAAENSEVLLITTTTEEQTTTTDTIHEDATKASTTTTAATESTSIKHAEEASETTESSVSLTSVPLAPFTTTPTVQTELSHSEPFTKSDFVKPSASRSTENQQLLESTTDANTNAGNLLTTTSSSGTTSTTTASGAESAAPSVVGTPTTTKTAENEMLSSADERAGEAAPPTEQEVDSRTTTTTAAAIEVPLYKRTLNTQQQAVSENVEAIETAGVEYEAAPTTKAAVTTATAVAAATETTTTAEVGEATSAATTVLTSAIPTTTITSTSAAPESTTTTTTTPPTTTTLSPMSLIVAEHEARSLDRTPPRVSRIVTDDGVEVLSGYSIVHHMHAAALAALAAMET